jgi:molecular chaperone DnaJ
MAQRDWLEKDYYKILGVSEKASKDEIKRAYRKLAQKYHPDAAGGDEARFKEISEAHAILSNDKKRAEYDEFRRLAAAGGERIFGFRPGGQGGVRVTIGDVFGDEGFDDLLGNLFGFNARPRRGRDIETEVSLSFEEAVRGTTRTIGGVRVRIPPGVRDGARIRVPGRGERTAEGPPGDLYVVTRVAPHPLLRQGRRGDLLVELPVTIAEAALGAEVDVPTLDGHVTVKVPPGTQHGTTLRVRGRGGPRPGGGTGDLLVKVAVVVPTKLSRKERELLEQFAALHRGSPREHMETAARKVQAS